MRVARVPMPKMPATSRMAVSISITENDSLSIRILISARFQEYLPAQQRARKWRDPDPRAERVSAFKRGNAVFRVLSGPGLFGSGRLWIRRRADPVPPAGHGSGLNENTS